MDIKYSAEFYRERGLALLALTAMTLLFSGHHVTANAEDHHEHHQHHKAIAESKGYKSLLTAYSVPNVNLVDSKGQEGVLSELIRPDKPVMLNFIFTTCTTICPTMSASFAQVAQQLDADDSTMQLISISVDPEHDTPAILAEYAKKFGTTAQWRLLTGTVGNSILAQRAFDAYRGDKMNHIPLTFIRDANSNQWLRVEGLVSADELIKEFHSLAHQH